MFFEDLLEMRNVFPLTLYKAFSTSSYLNIKKYHLLSTAIPR